MMVIIELVAVLILTVVAIDANEISKTKLLIIDRKQMIEEAGCTFFEAKQFLRKHVCTLPHYDVYEPPNDMDGQTNVDVDFWKPPKILEINEKKNRITIQVVQFVEWQDSRIKINISSMPRMSQDSSYIKFTPGMVEKIWHPYLDLHIDNLRERKSISEPHWFEPVGIVRCPWMRKCKTKSQETVLFSNTDWRITIFCMFDFSSFPFDTQRCNFRQIVWSSDKNLKLFIYPPFAPLYTVNITRKILDWNYEVSGFEAKIVPVGNIVDPSTELQLSNASDFGFNIELTRIFRPYLFQYYLPTAAIVIVSHISFMIPLSSIPGRVALMVTQFLTLTNIFILNVVRKSGRNIEISLFKDIIMFFY